MADVYTPTWNETPLPTHYKISSMYVSPDSASKGQEAIDFERLVRRALASQIVEWVAHTMDIKERSDLNRMETRHVGSVYIFNERQLKDFIREVEDTVKENLAT